MRDISKVERQLEKRLAELRARAEPLAAARSIPVSADSEDRAAEVEDDEVIEHQTDALHGEIAAIVAALHRIEQGGYGICTSCENPISPARLAVMPTTALCIDCARARTA